MVQSFQYRYAADVAELCRYAASKGAVEQLTRIFAKEAGGRGITANIVSPGPVNTEMFTTGKSEETIKGWQHVFYGPYRRAGGHSPGGAFSRQR